jgi:hypothetical protein
VTARAFDDAAAGSPPAAQPGALTPPAESVVVRFLKYRHRINFSGPAVDTFRQYWRNPRLALSLPGRNPAEVEVLLDKRVKEWCQDTQTIYQCLQTFDEAYRAWATFFLVLRERVLAPCDQQLGQRWLFFFLRRTARLYLRTEDYQVLNEAFLQDALRRLAWCASQADVLCSRRIAEFRHAIRGWRGEHARLRIWAADLEEEARQQWTTINRAHVAWRQRFQEALSGLGQYLAQLQKVLFAQAPFQPTGKAEFPLVLDGPTRSALQPRKAARAIDRIRKEGLGPGLYVESEFAILQFEEIRQALSS